MEDGERYRNGRSSRYGDELPSPRMEKYGEGTDIAATQLSLPRRQHLPVEQCSLTLSVKQMRRLSVPVVPERGDTRDRRLPILAGG